MWSWFSKKSDEKKTLQQAEPGAQKGWFSRLAEKLAKTKNAILSPLLQFFQKKTLSPDMEFELKKALLEADFGPKLTKEMIEKLKTHLSSQEQAQQLHDKENFLSVIKNFLLSLCIKPEEDWLEKKVFLMIGVNGAGKTTTCAKIASLISLKNPLLVAADTFRAAAVNQLKEWAARGEFSSFASDNADPAAVVYQGLEHAQKYDHQSVIIDTAGRLHNNKNLINELTKIKKIILKKIDHKELVTVLILDGSQGQSMVQQVEYFHQAMQVDILIITKLDGTSKGGAIFEVMRTHKIPLGLIGCGESLDDIQPFEPQEFIDALFGGE